jgi:hypothetical protein
MKRHEMIEAIAGYYTDIGRVKCPKYDEYSLCELRKCIVLFKLRLSEKK